MRLDKALVAQELVRSRSHAADLIKNGKVRVNSEIVTKPGTHVRPTDDVSAEADHYVSRAAHKLIGALDESGTAVSGRCLDAGASTGGFTQVLLERGADTVIAIDVGHSQLDPVLSNDPRVVNLEKTNLRDLTLDMIGEPVDLVVADVSFISLQLLLKPLFSVMKPDAVALLMVKPQFEVGKGNLDSKGVVRTVADQIHAVEEVVQAAAGLGWGRTWQGVSQLPGPAGNVEYFVKLQRP